MKTFLRGWGLATPSFKWCKIAHTLLRRSCTLCFETVLEMNKITPTPSPPLKNKISKNFFYSMICLKYLFKGVRVEMGTKSEKVCMCVCVCMYVCDAYISKVHGHFGHKFGMVPSKYWALMVFNFCGDRGLGARTKLFGVSN